MGFALTSHMTLQAAIGQYFVDCDAPVGLTLHGPNSYCYLKGIQSSQLKAILSKVGDVFEKNKGNTFFNVCHTFTPVEATESKSSGNDDDQIDKNHTTEVRDIFAFVKTAVSEQTSDQLTLDLADVNRLVVQKAVDRSFLMGPHQAYELEVTIPEKTVEAAEKSGLIFRKYGLSQPSDEPAYVLGVGQHALFT
jgi:hypothetical protein